MTGTDTLAPGQPRDNRTPLRFGVMCRGELFQRWQADALSELRDHGHQLELLIVDQRPVEKLPLFQRIMHKKWGTILFSFLNNRIFKPDARREVDLGEMLHGVDMLEARVDERGYSEHFSESDVARIKGYRLDFILRFGFNIIRGDILTAAKYGVWSFHHDDELIYRGGPAGFWEIFRDDPVSGAVLQQLTNRLDGGIILKKGYLKTLMHSYRENLDQLLSVSSSWPARVADQIAGVPADQENHGYSKVFVPSSTAAPLFRVPGNLQTLKFLLLLLRNRVRFYIRELFFAEIWNVGVISKPIHEVALGGEKLTAEEISWLPCKVRHGYLADPSGYLDGDRLHILAEHYSYTYQKAGISEIAGDHQPVRVIAGTSHLSYPFTFKHQDEIYCIPESYQSDKITLYRRDRVTSSFVAERVLLEGIHAIDPTLFLYHGRWWLFFTSRKFSNTHLYIFHSDGLDGEFMPHRNNPVKTDIRSSRPAGTPFIDHDVLYRPAQDCSVTYGGRIAVNKVLKLTPEEFEEQVAGFVEPVEGGVFGKGLHTMSAVGNITLIDGKMYKFDSQFFIHQLVKKLKRKESGNV